MAKFTYEISGNLLSGFYVTDNGLMFQSEVNLSDYDSELLAAAAAQSLGEEYSKKYEEQANEQK